MKLTIDFETRSRVNLKKAGNYVYAADPSTEIMCQSFKVDDGEPHLWVPDYWAGVYTEGYKPQYIIELVDKADIIEPHNASFERWIWYYKLHLGLGWPDIPIEKLRCSAAKAAMHGLPRDLDRACQVMALSEQKDKEGHRIMMKMCKPRKPTKNNPSEWHEDPEDFRKLCMYCKQDVNAEYALSESLTDLPPRELELWRLDQKINDRGVPLDMEGARSMVSMCATQKERLKARIKDVTAGEVDSPSKVGDLLSWVNDRLGTPQPDPMAGKIPLSDGRGVRVDPEYDAPKCAPPSMDCLKADVIKGVLKTQIPDDVREALEARQAYAKTSTAKYDSMLVCADDDGRARGCHMFHGAGTGRWTGLRVQFQNTPRGTLTLEQVQEIIELVKDDPDGAAIWLEAVHCLDPMEVASSCLRGHVCAPDGYELVCADYSSIESRVRDWLAGEEWKLEMYRTGKADPYKLNAMVKFNIAYDMVTKKQRQSGKVIELAAGYQGWISAWKKACEAYGMAYDEEEGKDTLSKWRKRHPRVVALWKGLEEACGYAVMHPGKVTEYRGIRFIRKGEWLYLRLPSGRLLYYAKPNCTIEERYGKKQYVTTYWHVNSETKRWEQTNTYGGKLTENVVQAISRDLLREGMFAVEDAGYPVVFHVHDELVAQVLEGQGSLEEFCELMCTLPEWAQGCPVGADGWRGKRYRKD